MLWFTRLNPITNLEESPVRMRWSEIKLACFLFYPALLMMDMPGHEPACHEEYP
jgi:hypothetical protein